MGILDAPHLADGASDRSVRPRSPVGGVMSRSCAGFRAREPARDHVGRLRRLAERRLGGSLPARASAGAAPAEVGAPTARTSTRSQSSEPEAGLHQGQAPCVHTLFLSPACGSCLARSSQLSCRDSRSLRRRRKSITSGLRDDADSTNQSCACAPAPPGP